MPSGKEVTPGFFSQWLHGASPGEKIVYHTGAYAQSDACKLARASCKEGLTVLFQRKKETDVYEYLAIKVSPATLHWIDNLIEAAVVESLENRRMKKASARRLAALKK